MNIKAIVYTSNTGYTAEYARLLGEKTGLPVYSLEEAKQNLTERTEIVYLGWLMASMVKGYGEASKLYNISLVCGVCLGTGGSQMPEVRKMNKLPKGLPLFTLQGGFDMNKLRGMNKFMMKIMKKILTKQINGKEEQTEDDRAILHMLNEGGSCVSEENLAPVIELIKE